MAKKKIQSQQLLSPENYIRQKARNLPIYECRINNNWQEIGTATVVIARIHINGNLTYGLYMVDLYCLGVRNTHYQFNTPVDNYEDLLDMLSENFEMQQVEYSLVHNIILAANEYAADLGFKPHKDFTSVSEYLLEEDTDDIELIEIECGKDGKPLFIQSEFIADVEAKRIISQLEKSVGKGNFDVIMRGDNNDDDDDDEMDFDDDSDDEFHFMEYEEKIGLFQDFIANGLDDIPDDEKKRLIALTDSIYFMDLCDEDEVNDLCERWEVELNMAIDDETYTAELLSQESGRIITEEEKLELDELELLMKDKPQKAEKQIKKLKQKWGNIPYLNYKELKLLELINAKGYKKKRNDYLVQFAEYPLFKLESYKQKLQDLVNTHDLEIIDFEDIFEGRSSITETEMFEFQMMKLLILIVRGKMNEIEAMYDMLDDFEFSEKFYMYLQTILVLTRISLLDKYLEIEEL